MLLKPSRETVLLLGSTPDERAMYAHTLLENGFAVQEAETTDEVANSATNATVIVTELRVPGSLSAIELIGQLRAKQRRRPQLIVVVTASVTRGDEDAARGAGVDEFLRKPLVPDELVSDLRALISRTRRSGQGRDNVLSPRARRRVQGLIIVAAVAATAILVKKRAASARARRRTAIAGRSKSLPVYRPGMCARV